METRVRVFVLSAIGVCRSERETTRGRFVNGFYYEFNSIILRFRTDLALFLGVIVYTLNTRARHLYTSADVWK